jgi:hypothetical protein
MAGKVKTLGGGHLLWNMFQWVAKLLNGNRSVPVERIEDPVLGVMRLDDPVNRAWVATVEINGKRVEFKIGGDATPSKTLLRHAHEIVNSFGDFERMIADFLAREAQRPEPAAEAIRRLEMDAVCLFWPDRPYDGMIYFKGSEEYGQWRCDYISRKPVDLGFDS